MANRQREITRCLNADFVSLEDRDQLERSLKGASRETRSGVLDCDLEVVESYQAPADPWSDPCNLLMALEALKETLSPHEQRSLRHQYGLTN